LDYSAVSEASAFAERRCGCVCVIVRRVQRSLSGGGVKEEGLHAARESLRRAKKVRRRIRARV